MHYNLYRDSRGEWRWQLRAGNYKVIADSGEGYVNKSDALNGISLVKQSYNSPIYESTNV
ncbi:YegP family protein [Celeribacter halophilus]|uniref:YegP family protein n=1 Tax=Celeribacter halophilus TaxID=576117 RepID=UPI003A940F31